MNKFIGVDIGGTKMYMLAEYNGKYIEKKVSTGINVTPKYLKHEIDSFISSLPFIPAGIGIAMPGLVENKNTLIVSYVLPNLNGIKSEYFSADSYNVHFINDVKAALVAETINYPEWYTTAVIMVGTGIALAVKTNGSIISGSKGWSGELGSIPIMLNNEVTTLNSVSSGAGILNRAKTDVENFLKLIQCENEGALKIIKEASTYFGLALASIINLYNPDVIVVGGSTSTYKGYMKNAVNLAKNYSLKESFNCCKITSPKDIKRIVALGAMEFSVQMHNDN
ncbi:ROK family protein [Clostridium lundense]|uniref:ROK family protein n=1 Tax=Clostridium lundense TaxID=319475 RepID=UPI000485E353|nr:ROK family protein [Clostridium lundense]